MGPTEPVVGAGAGLRGHRGAALWVGASNSADTHCGLVRPAHLEGSHGDLVVLSAPWKRPSVKGPAELEVVARRVCNSPTGVVGVRVGVDKTDLAWYLLQGSYTRHAEALPGA